MSDDKRDTEVTGHKGHALLAEAVAVFASEPLKRGDQVVFIAGREYARYDSAGKRQPYRGKVIAVDARNGKVKVDYTTAWPLFPVPDPNVLPDILRSDHAAFLASAPEGSDLRSDIEQRGMTLAAPLTVTIQLVIWDVDRWRGIFARVGTTVTVSSEPLPIEIQIEPVGLWVGCNSAKRRAVSYLKTVEL